MAHQKYIPMRMCVGCGEMKPKKELLRIVKNLSKNQETNEQNKEISIDITGKSPGRGAYLCKNGLCIKAARKNKRLERTFSQKIPDTFYQEIEENICDE